MEYFSLHPVLSRNATLNMVIGHRSAGKTYAFKDWALRDFLKNGKQFIYLRRNRNEVANIRATLFDDIIDKYNVDIRHEGVQVFLRQRPTPEMTAKEIKKLCPWRLFGFIIPLSLQQTYKSAAYPNVNKICLDEFIIENHRQKYLENEVRDLLSFYFTVDRGRNDVRLVLLSNSGFIDNPYFTAYNIKYTDLMKSPWVFRKNKKVLLHYYSNESNTEELKDDNIGQISTDEYSAYALENKFNDATDEFITEKKPKDFTYYLTLTDGDNYLSIYKSIQATTNESLWVTTGKKGDVLYSTNPSRPILNAPYESIILSWLKQCSWKLMVTYQSPETRIRWYDMLNM